MFKSELSIQLATNIHQLVTMPQNVRFGEHVILKPSQVLEDVAADVKFAATYLIRISFLGLNSPTNYPTPSKYKKKKYIYTHIYKL